MSKSKQPNHSTTKHNHENCEHHNHTEHHDHAHCGHDHSHENHDHVHCGHDHSHEHHDHTHCGHDHSHENHQRYVFSEKETQHYESLSLENLMQQADDFLSGEEFGKVVPIFEIALAKIQTTKNLQDINYLNELINIKQNLAFAYGIIGEHTKAIPLWKSVIEHKEQNMDDVSDLLDDYFGIALSCEQCEMQDDFLMYIQKGLNLARENQFPEYVASFEHELGGFYCDLSEFKKAEKHLESAIKIREKLGDIVGLAMSKMYMGILFEDQKKYPEAKQFYEKALELTKNQDFCDELVGERAELELRLSKIKNLSLKDKLFSI